MSRHRRKSSFVDSTFPAPGSQTSHWPTSLSSALIALFVCVACYLALNPDSVSSTWLGTWVYPQSRIVDIGPQIWPDGVDLPNAPAVSDQWKEESQEDIGNEGPESGAMGSELDYQQYRWHRDLAWEPSSAKGRLIIIGDIHGMINQFKTLLADISYDNETDTLVLVGDLVAKASNVLDSVAVVSLARSIGAKAVRGNHDDLVVGYRSWLDSNGASGGALAGDSLETQEESSSLRGKLPKGWKWRAEHLAIARNLSSDDFQWMVDRSLSLHIRSLHAYIVHAGLLPETVPKRSLLEVDPEGDLESTSPYEFEPSQGAMDKMTADDAVLLRRQNRKPSTLLEMRGVTRNGTRPHSDGHRGTPWPVIWNEQMARCEDRAADCRALSVVYGHWAHRGLQIDPYSIGLDTGCVYGRSLSALVLQPDRDYLVDYAAALETQEATLGGRSGVVYSMSC